MNASMYIKHFGFISPQVCGILGFIVSGCRVFCILFSPRCCYLSHTLSDIYSAIRVYFHSHFTVGNTIQPLTSSQFNIHLWVSWSACISFIRKSAHINFNSSDTRNLWPKPLDWLCCLNVLPPEKTTNKICITTIMAILEIQSKHHDCCAFVWAGVFLCVCVPFLFE